MPYRSPSMVGVRGPEVHLSICPSPHHANNSVAGASRVEAWPIRSAAWPNGVLHATHTHDSATAVQLSVGVGTLLKNELAGCGPRRYAAALLVAQCGHFALPSHARRSRRAWQPGALDLRQQADHALPPRERA
eukprot:COSAG05_NODE_1281_length_5287_cov_51.775636_6_plen_133_part_00